MAQAFLEKLQPLSQELIGADLSIGMLEMPPRGWRSSGSTICGDAEQLPLASASCGLCFSTLALQWCLIADASAEIRRVVRPGGYLALATLSDGSLCELRQSGGGVDTLDLRQSTISRGSAT